NDCSFMKLNTMEKLRDCLRDLAPAIEVDPEVSARAVRPIERMLALS
ncbi:MAG TPA: quinolinate synthase, partial [Porphyromonadaceae bacterium]|nr:quinolinate synthase [Porphyromonadaceae bacterium]